MFITAANLAKASQLSTVKQCLIYWPKNHDCAKEISERNVIVECDNPHLEFCRFFQSNNIVNTPKIGKIDLIGGAYISDGAKIGAGTTIFPGVYIDCEVVIGANSIIGSGTRIIGKVTIGDHVIIRENSVIGADGLTTDRDENGKAVSMPQFGGVIIEDQVEIGANTVIARGAIDNTIIHSGSKIDNCCFISHNVEVGEDTFIVGETIMFGSSSTGKQVYVSGNATIRNGIHIGEKALVGMGAVVTKPVPPNTTVIGNPAKPLP